MTNSDGLAGISLRHATRGKSDPAPANPFLGVELAADEYPDWCAVCKRDTVWFTVPINGQQVKCCRACAERRP